MTILRPRHRNSCWIYEKSDVGGNFQPKLANSDRLHHFLLIFIKYAHGYTVSENLLYDRFFRLEIREGTTCGRITTSKSYSVGAASIIYYCLHGIPMQKSVASCPAGPGIQE